MAHLYQLDDATNERLAGEANLLPGITVHELVFGVPYSHVVNAAFTHAQPQGSRFNGPDRGVWYASFSFKTAQAEVAFHYSEWLREINWQEEETVVYREFLADFRADFHDLRSDSAAKKYLRPDSYRESQRLGRQLLHKGSSGIVYPACGMREGLVSRVFVRRWWGTCARERWSSSRFPMRRIRRRLRSAGKLYPWTTARFALSSQTTVIAQHLTRPV